MKRVKILINPTDRELLKKLSNGWAIESKEIVYDNSILLSRYNEFGKKPYVKIIISRK